MMTEYWLETKKVADGGYYPTGKDGHYEILKSLPVARARLMKRIKDAPYYCELGGIQGSKNGMGYTVGIIRYNWRNGIFIWDDYGTNKKYVLRKDGSLGRRV